jgi:formate dehydrogenase iron-sulfur subunit
MAFTALAGFFHFVRVGPNEVDERDEAAARQALEAAPQRTAPQRPGAQPPDKRP